MAPKSFRFGEYETSVLLQLYEKVTLTCSHFHKLCFAGLSLSSVQKVLLRMKRAGYIESASYCLGQRGKMESVYLLTKLGWQALVDLNLLEKSICPFRIKHPPQRLSNYLHQMAIVRYWIDLECDLAKYPRYELGLFMPEYKRLENGKTITLKHEFESGEIWQVRNDAIFSVVDLAAKREYLYLLEIDRGTMPIRAGLKNSEFTDRQPFERSSLEKKLENIQRLLSVSHLVFPKLGKRFARFKGARVVVITSSAQRVANMLRNIEIHPDLLRQQVFLFSHFGETERGAFGGRYAVVESSHGDFTTWVGLLPK